MLLEELPVDDAHSSHHPTVATSPAPAITSPPLHQLLALQHSRSQPYDLSPLQNLPLLSLIVTSSQLTTIGNSTMPSSPPRADAPARRVTRSSQQAAVAGDHATTNPLQVLTAQSTLKTPQATPAPMPASSTSPLAPTTHTAPTITTGARSGTQTTTTTTNSSVSSTPTTHAMLAPTTGVGSGTQTTTTTTNSACQPVDGCVETPTAANPHLLSSLNLVDRKAWTVDVRVLCRSPVRQWETWNAQVRSSTSISYTPLEKQPSGRSSTMASKPLATSSPQELCVDSPMEKSSMPIPHFPPIHANSHSTAVPPSLSSS